MRRLHPLSRSYSSGAILETEREHDDFGSFDDYSYDYDEDEEEEEDQEDHTLEESGQWAQRHRLGRTSQPASWQRRHQPPPSARSRNRRNHPSQTTSRTSTGSIGSGFSLEVTIPEGTGTGEERSKTPSRLRRPSSHATSIGAGGRDSTGSSSLDNRSSEFSSSGQRRSGGEDSNHGTNSGGNGNTPSSASSTLSIPMPSTPKDIFDPAAPPLFSSTRGMLSANKEKSLPPLPAGGLKKKSSMNLQKSNGTSSSTTTPTPTTTAGPLNGTGKYAFPSTRIRTFSSASPATSTPSPASPIPVATGGSSSIISPSSSVATIKPNVRPLQLPRQTARVAGDRAAVPVPSPTLNSPPLPLATLNSLRAPTPSLSSLARHRTSLSPILSGHAGTSSAPPSPAINGGNMAATTGIARPKPRTGTGMVYRTSSGSKMRAPMILSGTSSVVSNASVSGGGVGGSIGRSNGLVGAIAL